MPGSRRRRILLVVALIPVALLIAMVTFMRLSRGRFTPPELVSGTVWRLHTQVADFYAARAGGKVMLVDSGADPEGRGLDALLTALGAHRDDVSDVLITHGHNDHIAAAPLCSRARVRAGIGDADMMAKRAPMVPRMPRIFGALIPAPAVTVSDAFVDRVEITIAPGATVLAIPFSGHTPGSMLYLFDGVLFVGDSLMLQGGKLHPAPSAFDVDLPELRRHIANLASFVDLTKVRVVCSGHGGCTREADTQRALADAIKEAS
jgi:hydroxyacylglutathione hydrolase